jgi:TPR repeat protein
VPQNQAEAVRWFRKAADQGNANALYLLGAAYFDGKGVPQNYSEAVRWWKKAADQGDASAQHTLGIAYDEGLGVPQDHADAYFWTNLAAALNKGQDDSAAKLRNSIGAKLPREELSEIQKKCSLWLAAFEKRKALK